MRRTPARGWVLRVWLASVVALPACEGPTDPTTDATCQTLLKEPNSADAFEWLVAPTPGPRDLGGMTTDQALALAHKFEGRGARRLVAVGNRVVEHPPDPPTSRSLGLVVELPEDLSTRRALFALYAEQVRNRGLGAQADVGQTFLFVPWGMATEP